MLPSMQEAFAELAYYCIANMMPKCKLIRFGMEFGKFKYDIFFQTWSSVRWNLGSLTISRKRGSRFLRCRSRTTCKTSTRCFEEYWDLSWATYPYTQMHQTPWSWEMIIRCAAFFANMSVMWLIDSSVAKHSQACTFSGHLSRFRSCCSYIQCCFGTVKGLLKHQDSNQSTTFSFTWTMNAFNPTHAYVHGYFLF